MKRNDTVRQTWDEFQKLPSTFMTVPDVWGLFWWYCSSKRSNVGISTCVQVLQQNPTFSIGTSCNIVYSWTYVLYWSLFISLWTKLTYWDRLPLSYSKNVASSLYKIRSFYLHNFDWYIFGVNELQKNQHILMPF